MDLKNKRLLLIGGAGLIGSHKEDVAELLFPLGTGAGALTIRGLLQ